MNVLIEMMTSKQKRLNIARGVGLNSNQIATNVKIVGNILYATADNADFVNIAVNIKIKHGFPCLIFFEDVFVFIKIIPSRPYGKEYTNIHHNRCEWNMEIGKPNIM